MAVPLPLFEPVYRGGIFTTPSSLITLLSTIAGTLAALVGITIAVVLVALEILRGTYAAIALRELFRTSSFRHLLCLYLYTIGLALFVAVWIGSSVPPQAIALTYLVGFLTFTCLVVLYPALKRILTSARVDQTRLRKLAASIERHAPFPAHRGNPEGHLEYLEDDPLFVLSEVAFRSLSSGDRVTPRMVIGVVSDRFRQLVEQDTERSTDGDGIRDLFGRFVPFFQTVGRTAVKHCDELTLHWLFAAIQFIHVAAARSKVPWHSLIEFNELLEDMAVRCAEAGLGSTTRRVLDRTASILEAHLRDNVPEERTLWLLNWQSGRSANHIEHDSDKDLQWDDVSRRYLDIYLTLTQRSLDLAQFDVATAGQFGLSRIMEAVERLDNLGPAQKSQLIRRCILHAERVIVDTARKRPANALLMTFPLGALHLAKWLERDTEWSKMAVLHLCSTLLRLAEVRRLNAHCLNELGTLARGCIEKVDEAPRFVEAVVLACETFQHLATDYAAPASLADVLVVRELEQQLESLRSWFNSKHKRAAVAETRVHDAIAEVRSIVVPETFERLEKLTWPTLPAGTSVASQP